jgi:DNA-nicking Smr family endonuclease
MGNFLSSVASGLNSFHNNNTAQLPKEELYKRYLEEREKASLHAKQRNQYFQQSQDAYRSGNKADATYYSQLGKEQGTLMLEANTRAADFVFEFHNRERPLDEIDLHNLFVEEAMQRLKERIATLQQDSKLQTRIASSQQPIKRPSTLVVIVGRGNNSANGTPRIKPAVESYLQSIGLRYDFENEGSLQVHLASTQNTCTIL